MITLRIIREKQTAGYRPYATQVKDRISARSALELKQLKALLQSS